MRDVFGNTPLCWQSDENALGREAAMATTRAESDAQVEMTDAVLAQKPVGLPFPYD